MGFGRQRGFLLDGEDPPEKVGCRKLCYLQVKSRFKKLLKPISTMSSSQSHNLLKS